MANSAQRIEMSFDNMRKIGMVLCAVLVLIAIATIAVFGSAFVVACQSILNGAAVIEGVVELGEGGSIALPNLALWAVLLLAGEFTLLSISFDVARRQSPFTIRHARMIGVIACLFAINAVMGSLQIGSDLKVMMGNCMLSCRMNSALLQIGDSGITLDVGSIIAMMVAFALSIFWRYGALLQSQSDDLV